MFKYLSDSVIMGFKEHTCYRKFTITVRTLQKTHHKVAGNRNLHSADDKPLCLRLIGFYQITPEHKINCYLCSSEYLRRPVTYEVGCQSTGPNVKDQYIQASPSCSSVQVQVRPRPIVGPEFPVSE